MSFLSRSWWLERLVSHLRQNPAGTQPGMFPDWVIEEAYEKGLIEASEGIYTLTAEGFDWAEQFAPDHWERQFMGDPR